MKGLPYHGSSSQAGLTINLQNLLRWDDVICHLHHMNNHALQLSAGFIHQKFSQYSCKGIVAGLWYLEFVHWSTKVIENPEWAPCGFCGSMAFIGVLWSRVFVGEHPIQLDVMHIHLTNSLISAGILLPEMSSWAWWIPSSSPHILNLNDYLQNVQTTMASFFCSFVYEASAHTFHEHIKLWPLVVHSRHPAKMLFAHPFWSQICVSLQIYGDLISKFKYVRAESNSFFWALLYTWKCRQHIQIVFKAIMKSILVERLSGKTCIEQFKLSSVVSCQLQMHQNLN